MAGRKIANPVSTHLKNIFRTWAVDYMYLSNDFDLYFEFFEYIACIAYITTYYDKKRVGDVLLAKEYGQNFARAPIGQFRWNWDRRAQKTFIYEIITKDEEIKSLLAAGLAGGDMEFYNAAVQSVENQVEFTYTYG